MLRVMGRAVARRPVLLVSVLVVVTLAAGWIASDLEVETDITEFSAETELSGAFDRIEEDFGGRGRWIQVIVEAGPGGNVLSPEGLALTERIVDVVEDADEVERHLAPDGLIRPSVVSYAHPFVSSFSRLDADVEELPASWVSSFVVDILDLAGERIEPLLSNDADLATGTARAGLVVISLDHDLDEEEVRQANLAVREALSGMDTGSFDVLPFSFALLSEDMEEGIFEDLPVLMTASFLLIIVILWLLFRRVSDLVLGVAAMGLAIVWMTGAAVLLGPGYLGATGPFNQIAIAVPVLLVGLGIDYTVHLIARYRENLAAGYDPPSSAEIAVRTVGLALVLATITTVVGFLSNLVTPLPPIADFGVFAAAGIVAAFVVTGLLVPGVRAMLDRRRAARGTALVDGRNGSTGGVARLGTALAHVADVSTRAPVTLLVAALLVAGSAGWLASDLDTEFSQDDFIPADSEAGRLIDVMEARFGGDVSERTYVLVDGDMSDPAVANAVLDSRDRMGDTPDVATVGDVADLSSAPTLIAKILDEADDARERVADQLGSFADPEGAAADLPLPTIRGPEDLPGGLEEDASDEPSEGEPPEDDSSLVRRLTEGVDLADALLSALSPEEIEQMLREVFAERLRSVVPDDVDVEVLEAAADLEPEEIDRASLAAIGFPVDELDEDALDLIDTAVELRELGWRDGRVAPDADLDEMYDVLGREAPSELAAVLAADRRSGVMSVATTAGQTGADELVAALETDLAPLGEAGAEILVASEPLLLDETLEILADAQTKAIVISLVAAALLMVGYYGLAHRRFTLGLIAVVPSLLAVVFTLGTMRVIGMSYNALTATVASIAIGIGVPYGIHVTNRFLEDRRGAPDPASGVRLTIVHTGAALSGSAITTAAAFGVLSLSNLGPVRQFGIISAIVILYALVSALLVESSCLVLWDRWHRRRDGDDASASPPPLGRTDPAPMGGP